MKEEMKAYYAGFIDGEAWIGYGHGGRKEVRVVNTYLPILQKLKDDYGGSIYERKKKDRHKTAYDWILSGKDDVTNFIRDIRPYLREKKEKIGFINSI